MSARASEVSHRSKKSSDEEEAPEIESEDGGNLNANIMLSQRGEVNVQHMNQGLDQEVVENVEMQDMGDANPEEHNEEEMQFPVALDVSNDDKKSKKDDAPASTGLKYTPVNDEAYEQAEQDNQ